jgi:hypothetical protein
MELGEEGISVELLHGGAITVAAKGLAAAGCINCADERHDFHHQGAVPVGLIWATWSDLGVA